MKTRKYGLCLLILAGLLSIIGCNKNKDITGNTSETGNALVSGRLYNEDNTPAVGAKVHFVRTGYDPYHNTLSKAFVKSDSATTDTNGVYKTNNLDMGTYNVYGTGTDGTLSLIDSVTITGDIQVVKGDTLKAPATLAGHIKLQPGDEPDKIIGIAMGSNTFSLISAAAQFSFANLAEGHYAVKFFSTLDNYSNYDTTFTIVAGTNVSMPDSIVMPPKIPIPTGFIIKYDTLKQIVTLSWNRMNPAKVKGYNVYRQHVDSAEVKVNAQPLVDTFYVDSAATQDQIYVYSVASVDLGNKEGFGTAGDSIVILGAFNLIGSFGSAGSGDGQFNNPAGLAWNGSAKVYVADVKNNRIQVFDTNGIFLSKIGAPDIQFNAPIDVAVAKDGNIYVADMENNRVLKFDSLQHLVATLDSGLTRPLSIAVDSKNNLYVNEISSPLIKKYDSALHFVLQWGHTGNDSTATGGLTSIAIDSTDNIYLLNPYKVIAFDSLGNFIKSIPQSGTQMLRDITITGGMFFLADPDNKQILTFELNGNFVTKWGNSNFDQILALSNNSLWATIYPNQQVYRYRRR
jgi:hypothetical protein